MQTLKHAENSLPVPLFEADAVVFDDDAALFLGDRPPLSPPRDELARHLDQRRLVDAVKFQAVGNQILQQLPHLQRVGLDRRKMIDLDAAAHPFDLGLEIACHLASDLLKVDGRELLALRRDARKRKQPVDQRLHPFGRRLHPLETVDGRLFESVAADHLETIAEGANLP